METYEQQATGASLCLEYLRSYIALWEQERQILVSALNDIQDALTASG